MKRTDVVFYSLKNSEKLHNLLKIFFSTEKFLLYEINRKELLSKCWYDSFKYLVIDLSDQTLSNDKEISLIVNQFNFNDRRLILFLNDLKYDSLYIDNMKFEKVDNDFVLGKRNDETFIIIIKTLDTLFKRNGIIYNSWNLLLNETTHLNHSDIYVLTKLKSKYSEFKEVIQRSNIGNFFQYNNIKFSFDFNKFDSDPYCKFLIFQDKNYSCSEEINSFNKDEYFSSLRTHYLGQIVIYAEIFSSSYDFLNRFVNVINNDIGLIVISKFQTDGKGRGNNKWISPNGCAMFSCSISIDINSNLGNSMCLIQHIMAVSIIEALCSEFKIKEDFLKIKWPNDIYWSNHGKICGIIAKSSTSSKKFNCIIGCGINVSNNDPTVCLHDLLKSTNLSCQLPSIEKVIGYVMTHFEQNISDIQLNSNGIEKFKTKYYRYWMHGGQCVTVQNDSQNIKGRITGINNFGFLLMAPDDMSKESLIMLHPDGNSFDLMHNLITMKK